MSGGFFRGTTADQDTRFSNKQAKLLKTQKFPPELEHLIDVSKVKMDVIKPWIATRVTELLGGFEDEVLINFIYGLLEGKEINGKSIQIQLTGFMEKNTGKFMKELWALLLSAQENASGVPQQFLDAKEEETKKKKAETDRIFNEIQRKDEKELEQEKERKLDGGRGNNSFEDSKRRQDRGYDARSGDENGAGVQNGVGERKRSPKSPYSSDRSPSPHQGRSMSRSSSPRPTKHSVSPGRVQRTPIGSVSPWRQPARESISPRQRSHSRRRSSSRTRYRSRSPLRRRLHSSVHRRALSPAQRRSPSPFRRRSPSLIRRRSPSPFRRRSPLRRRSPPRWRRSPSPWRRRSPSPRRRGSPSPVRQRRRRSSSSPRSQSPVQRRPRSPVRRRYRSPAGRSPYPVRRRSPSMERRGSPSPRRRRSVRRRSPSPAHRSPVRAHRRSPSISHSLDSRSSASPAIQMSASPVKMQSPRRRSSVHGSPRERTQLKYNAEPAMMARRQSMAMTPQRDHSDSNRSRRKVPSVSPSPTKSPSFSPQNRNKSAEENRRLASPRRARDRISPGSPSPLTGKNLQGARHGSPGASEDELQNARLDERNRYNSGKGTEQSSGGKNRESPGKPSDRFRDTLVSRQNNTELPREEDPPKELHPGKVTDERRNPHSKDSRVNIRSDALVNSSKIQRNPAVPSDSVSEGSDKPRSDVTRKRKHKRSSRRDATSDSTSSESDIEYSKEAKRRKKEKRKLRKEERRQRREERHRKREEKRASKRKRKSKTADTLFSDVEKNEKIVKASNGEHVGRKYSSEEEETESQKKRLEIELREKALESLRAKKGITG